MLICFVGIGDKTKCSDYNPPVLQYDPRGRTAYDLADGKYFQKVVSISMPYIDIHIPSEILKIKGGIFEDEHLSGIVYVAQNSLLWAIPWKVIGEILTPLVVDVVAISKAWVSAGYPKEWDGKKEIEPVYDSLQKQRTTLSRAIRKHERKLERLKECLHIIEHDMQARI